MENIIKCLLQHMIKPLLHLKRVDRVKVQLIWELCHSPLVGNSCPVFASALGQLKHSISARGISDVTCKVRKGVRKGSLQCLKESVWKLQHLLSL